MNRHDRRAVEAKARRIRRREDARVFNSLDAVERFYRSPIRAIAHHEAAHAVAAALLAIPCGDLTLLPTPQLDRERWLSERPKAPVSNAIVSLAGPLSDWHIEQTEGLHSDPGPNQTDIVAAQTMALVVQRPELGPRLFSDGGRALFVVPTEEEAARGHRWLAGVQQLTAMLVLRAWPQVQAVADALLNETRLSPDRVRSLVQGFAFPPQIGPSEAVLQSALDKLIRGCRPTGLT